MNKRINLYTKNLYIRRQKKSDLTSAYLSWLKNPLVTRYMAHGTQSVDKRSLVQYYLNFKNNPNDILFAVTIKNSGRHIGNVRLGPIEWFHKRSEFGIMIGDQTIWGKGYAYEAIQAVLYYAFCTLRLNRINIYVVQENKAAVAVYKKAGFIVEGCMRDNYCLDGKYGNVLIMGMLAKEFKENDRA